MAKIQSFKELIVWQRSIELVKEVYSVTSSMPKSELYGLTSQMRRASISIPSNISEGYKRCTPGEFIHFLGIANASSAELETQIIITSELYPDLGFDSCINLLQQIQKMLSKIIHTLISKR